MTNAQFPYKPELNAEKALLFARCFKHCIECEDITFDQKDQAELLRFMARVDEKASVQAWVERIAPPEPITGLNEDGLYELAIDVNTKDEFAEFSDAMLQSAFIQHKDPEVKERLQAETVRRDRDNDHIEPLAYKP